MSRQRTLSSSEMADFEFADEFLPVYDVSDAVATVADADPGTAWRALVDVDLLKVGREAPVVGMLGALRMLPEIIGHLLHGEPPAKPPESMRLRDLPSLPMYEGGWILLGEREGHEIALGLAGKAAPSRPAVPLGRRRPHMPSARKRGASASRQGYLSRGQSRTRRATQVRPIPFKREQPSGHPPARRLLLHEGRTRVAG
jgi:hypothetical protein